MTTTALTPENTGTKIVMTTQLVALQGKDMIEGAKTGNNAALDNLVKALS